MLVPNVEKGIQCLGKGKRLGITRLNETTAGPTLGNVCDEKPQKELLTSLGLNVIFCSNLELMITTCTAQTQELKCSFFNKKKSIYLSLQYH